VWTTILALNWLKVNFGIRKTEWKESEDWAKCWLHQQDLEGRLLPVCCLYIYLCVGYTSRLQAYIWLECVTLGPFSSFLFSITAQNIVYVYRLYSILGSCPLLVYCCLKYCRTNDVKNRELFRILCEKVYFISYFK